MVDINLSGIKMKCIITLVLTTILMSSVYASGSVSITRNLPENVNLNQEITVQIMVDINESNPPNAFVIEEYVPIGWEFVGSSPESLFFDEERSMSTWFFYSQLGLPIEDILITYDIIARNSENDFSSEISIAMNPGDPIEDYETIEMGGDVGGIVNGIGEIECSPSSGVCYYDSCDSILINWSSTWSPMDPSSCQSSVDNIIVEDSCTWSSLPLGPCIEGWPTGAPDPLACPSYEANGNVPVTGSDCNCYYDESSMGACAEVGVNFTTYYDYFNFENEFFLGRNGTTTCGDGIHEGMEQCDDGNLNDGDGCSSYCIVENMPVSATIPLINDSYKLVIGSTAKPADNIASIDIAGKFGLGLPIEDIEVSLDDNLIVVGGPCVNSIANNLMRNPVDCTNGFESGKGMIKIFNNGGNTQIIIAGNLSLDTRIAARALVNENLWSQMDSNPVITRGDSLDDVNVE
jgi:cysteine-rich repeat protein